MDNSTWLVGAQTYFTVNSKTFSTQDGSLKLQNITTSKGFDKYMGSDNKSSVCITFNKCSMFGEQGQMKVRADTLEWMKAIVTLREHLPRMSLHAHCGLPPKELINKCFSWFLVQIKVHHQDTMSNLTRSCASCFKSLGKCLQMSIDYMKFSLIHDNQFWNIYQNKRIRFVVGLLFSPS